MFFFLAFLCLSRPSVAEVTLPAWLLDNWTVTKVYEDNAVYPEPDHEPKVWLGGQVMKVLPDKLSLGGEICADFEVAAKRGTLRKVFVAELGKQPESIGVKPSRNALDYLQISCGKSFTGETLERDATPRLNWYIFQKSKDEIEMPFFGGAYLELHRAAPTS
jgi:hypothetical protein